MSDGYPFKMRELVGNRDGPRLLVTGGVHGDEYEPMVAVRRLMRIVLPPHADRPEGTALSKPRASQCERSEC